MSHFASLSLSNHSATLAAVTVTSNTHFGKSTAQNLVAESLYWLRDIEMALDSIITVNDGQLGKLGKPQSVKDIFPLSSSISNARTIQNQLTSITSHAASVQETKSCLLARSREFITKLEDAKRLWNKQTEGLPCIRL
jgi:hypothetical protein